MGVLLRLIIAVLLAVTAVPWCIDLLVATVRSHKDWAPEDPQSVLLGLSLGLVLLCWSRPNVLLHTFVHECCHAVFCMVLRVRLHGFMASARNGGAVEHDPCDPLRSVLIAIAPYTLPFVLLPLLAAQTLVPDGPWRQLLSGLSAWAYVSHLQGLLINIRNNFFGKDSDLAKTGRPLGLVLIFGVLVLVTALTIQVLWNSPVLPWTRPG